MPRSPRGPAIPGPIHVPKPANDNIPKPANDNMRQRRSGLRSAKYSLRLSRYGFVGVGISLLTYYQALQRAKDQPDMGPFMDLQSGRWQIFCPIIGSLQYGYTQGTVCGGGFHDPVPGPGLFISPTDTWFHADGRYHWSPYYADPVPFFPDAIKQSAHWRRIEVAPKPAIAPGHRWYPDFEHDPFLDIPWLPRIDPEVEPPLRVRPRPDPVPRRLKPRQRPSRRSVPGHRPEFGPRTTTQPRPRTGTKLEPGRRNVPTSRPHDRRPPRKKEKEKKLIATNRVIQKLVNPVTEANDFVNSLFRALPRWVQNKCIGQHGVTIQARASCIYRNIDRMNVDKAVKNVILNEIEDRFFGALGKAQGKAKRNIFNQFGLQSVGTLAPKAPRKKRKKD